ncbi:hypothetical protein A2U01_0039703, partial [Trifolium medium]|nr:hypothetical protein [Trifolium medium]
LLIGVNNSAEAPPQLSAFLVSDMFATAV